MALSVLFAIIKCCFITITMACPILLIPINTPASEGIKLGNMAYFIGYNGTAFLFFHLSFFYRNKEVFNIKEKITIGFVNKALLSIAFACIVMIIGSIPWGKNLPKSYIMIYAAPPALLLIDIVCFFCLPKIQQSKMNAKLILIMNNFYGPPIFFGCGLLVWIMFIRSYNFEPYYENFAPYFGLFITFIWKILFKKVLLYLNYDINIEKTITLFNFYIDVLN